MKNNIIRLLQNTWGLLIFALLSGLAYFAVVMKFILQHTQQGGILVYFFAPLIICGAALVLVKLIKQCMESGADGKAIIIFWGHIAFMIVAASIAATMFI